MAAAITGTYKLVKYGYDSKKGAPFKPISDWYAGEISYDDNGRMSVIVRFAERPKDFTDIVAYSGTYKLNGSQIDHHVTCSVRPEYVGQNLSRTFKLENGELYTEFENTDEFIKFARWVKI